MKRKKEKESVIIYENYKFVDSEFMCQACGFINKMGAKRFKESDEIICQKCKKECVVADFDVSYLD